MICIKNIYESVIADSRIDFPQESLSPVIWDKNKEYVLKEEVKNDIEKAIKILKEQFPIIDESRIVGSICSNQYTDESDIDVHFTLNKTVLDDKEGDKLNKELKEFVEKTEELEEFYIGAYKVNFFFQINPFQDMMSAGVYDLDNDEWIVGPTEVPLDFNPYDEYKEAFPIIGEYVTKISIVMNNLKQEIKEYLADKDEKRFIKINNSVSDLLKIKKELREYRRSFSSPKSEDDAIKLREDKAWHQIDAVFKFIDKFGYLKKITIIERIFKDKSIISNNLEQFKNILEL